MVTQRRPRDVIFDLPEICMFPPTVPSPAIGEVGCRALPFLAGVLGSSVEDLECRPFAVEPDNEDVDDPSESSQCLPPLFSRCLRLLRCFLSFSRFSLHLSLRACAAPASHYSNAYQTPWVSSGRIDSSRSVVRNSFSTDFIGLCIQMGASARFWTILDAVVDGGPGDLGGQKDHPIRKDLPWCAARTR